ncbi:MAG: hypothetical protein A2939_01030 [Parcubacteria group bacterium RIFCSPLOWO2_01_FULL_48_18]|nr:MAG: hypothetical protein A3J67_01350 [Parcubacteria group bacterium RIFCSPHIGHO2_02_FULL_48_10b]OHB22055.1 MAG: hypothetical protein A2939_01030 [Parcubacteria group bacterium RIFCSPLOWO2_01_FULL_48_18]
MEDWVLIRRFISIAEAKIAKHTLESQGIKSNVLNSGVEFPGDLGDSYGADLYVWPNDLDKAKEIVDNYLRE